MDWPGEKLVIRLWETVADKGIGSLLKPWQIRREGRAHLDVRREELLLLAQAEKDAEAIRSGQLRLLPEHAKPGDVGGSGSAPLAREPERSSPMLPPIAGAVLGAAVADAIRKEVNVGRALVQAEAELSGDTAQPPPTKPNDDWLFRWRDSASAVSHEDLQKLWGRVLASEIKSPGQFSLRTLEFLRNISQDEAKAIEKLSRVMLGNIIYRNEAVLQPIGIDFEFLFTMQDLGVVSGVDSIGIEMTLKSPTEGRYVLLLAARDRGLLVSHSDPNRELRIPIYQVTKLGQQILKLSGIDIDGPVLTGIAQQICKLGFEVAIVRYEHVDQATVRYFDAVPVCGQSVTQPSA